MIVHVFNHLGHQAPSCRDTAPQAQALSEPARMACSVAKQDDRRTAWMIVDLFNYLGRAPSSSLTRLMILWTQAIDLIFAWTEQTRERVVVGDWVGSA